MSPPRVRIVSGEENFGDTHHLAQQNDVLATDEEKTDPLFGENVMVVYPFDSILQNQIGCKAGGGCTTARKNANI